MKVRQMVIFLLIFLSLPALAKKFTNQYCEFELPNGWECALEGSEWVCQHTNDERKKESIIILAAKKRGQQDSLEEYKAYLQKQKNFALPGGSMQVSEVKYATQKIIHDHHWVDALHLASEVPGFYTRYLATVKEDLGVAVTFSVGKDKYPLYQSIFDKIVETLKVFRDAQINVADYKPKATNEGLLDNNTFIPDLKDRNIGVQKKGASTIYEDATSYLILFVLLGIALFVFFKMKKNKKKKK